MLNVEFLMDFKSKMDLVFSSFPLYNDYYTADVQAIMNDAIDKYSGLTEGYWQRVRELALRIWLEYNRQEIFEVSH
jgi:hypothetical protein